METLVIVFKFIGLWCLASVASVFIWGLVKKKTDSSSHSGPCDSYGVCDNCAREAGWDDEEDA